MLNAAALIAFGRSVQRVFGTSAGIWYALFQASQFHVIYYASRTLPNMFAFVFSKLVIAVVSFQLLITIQVMLHSRA
jgi:alpha-1,6-mannosyltransferase